MMGVARVEWVWGTVAVVATLGATVLAAPSATSVPLAPHGDAVNGSAGAPVPLSPTSALLIAEGADGTAGTADDVTLLVTGLDGTPSVTALPTKYGSIYSSRIARMSVTRAALSTAGDDGVFGTADDTLLVLDRLGSENRVIPIVIGGLGDNQQFTPEPLSADRVVVSSTGPDLTADTADDELVVVSDPSGTPKIQRYTASFQRNSGRTHPIALSDTTVVVASDGADRKSSTADDVVHVVSGIGGTVQQASLPVPGLNRRAAGRPVRVTATLAAVIAAGPDLSDSTPDDVVALIDTALGTVTSVTVSNAKNASAGRPTVLTPNLLVCSTNGGDGIEGTVDDAVAVITGVGAANSVSFVVVGATGDDNNCRPCRVGADACALVNFGSDLLPGTFDDVVTLIDGIGTTTMRVRPVTVGAVATGTTSAVVPISSRSVVVAGGGADGTVGTLDDALVVIENIDSTPTTTSVPAGGAFDSMNSFRYVTEILGNGRGALLSTGPDGVLGAGSDDALRVLTGLDVGRSLVIRRLVVRRVKEGSQKRATVRLRGTLELEEPTAFGESDVTFSVGNAAQTLSAADFAERKGVMRYDDPRNERGFVRRVRYRLADGKLQVSARGAEEELATTSATYVPVGIELGGVLVPQSLSAREKGRRLVYKLKAKKK